MTTNRTPIERPALTMITPRAIDLYVAMGKLRCTCPPPSLKRSPCRGCRRWHDLHAELHDELRCEPWEWPCVARQSPKRAGSTCWNEDIATRMAQLKKAARRRTSEARVTQIDQGVYS
jgi:hypothetical protein